MESLISAKKITINHAEMKGTFTDKQIKNAEVSNFHSTREKPSRGVEMTQITTTISAQKSIQEDNSEFLPRKPQKCKIPILDPYHPEVKPFIKKVSASECDYPKLTEVTDDGILQVRIYLKISNLQIEPMFCCFIKKIIWVLTKLLYRTSFYLV